MAMDQDPTIITGADGKARCAIFVRRAKRYPSVARPADPLQAL